LQKFFLIYDAPPFDDGVSGAQVLWRNDLDLKLNASKKWSLVC
jgi:hypothetical protein